jgi:hypothetical protein
MIGIRVLVIKNFSRWRKGRTVPDISDRPHLFNITHGLAMFVFVIHGRHLVTHFGYRVSPGPIHTIISEFHIALHRCNGIGSGYIRTHHPPAWVLSSVSNHSSSGFDGLTSCPANQKSAYSQFGGISQVKEGI